MVLTRALVNWFRQSQHPTLSPSDASSDAASDNHESRHHAQSPAFHSLFPGILSSFLQSQFASRLSVTDQTATSPPNSPLYEFLTRLSLPAVTPASFTPAQLAFFSSHLPFMPPSQHEVRDAGLATAAISASSTDPVRVEHAISDMQMFQAERRHVGLSAVPRSLPTFASLRG